MYTSARTLARGQSQRAVFTETSSTTVAHYPTLGVAYRIGLASRAELGLRAGGGPIGLDLKVGLLRGGLDLAGAPVVVGTGARRAVLEIAGAPLLTQLVVRGDALAVLWDARDGRSVRSHGGVAAPRAWPPADQRVVGSIG